MARINTNVASMIAQSRLARSQADLNVRLERLATGLRINRGSDDPAGLITSERMRSELSGLSAAISNSERAASVIATTEGALAEVADLLNSIQGLIVSAANTGGMSDEEISANQLQIDSAIESITRISNTASFAGMQLLNGSLDYLLSGVATSAIRKTNVLGANFGSNDSIAVNVDVIASAQQANIRFTADYVGAGDGTFISSVTLEFAGNEGVQVLSFVSTTTMSAVVEAVNRIADSTGVSATLVSATDLSSGVVFSSRGYGSDAFVSVERMGTEGDFWESHISDKRDIGQDVTAIVNGALAEGDGLNLAVKVPTLNIEMLLDPAFAQQTVSARSFHITGGGAQYQLGAQVKTNQQISFGVSSVAASRLGGTLISDEMQFLSSIVTGSDNDLDSENFDHASKIISSAIDEISVMRGQLGSIERNTLQTNIRSLQVAFENITSSESKIRDADFAVETTALTRAQILQQAGVSVLATANTTATSVLSLLG